MTHGFELRRYAVDYRIWLTSRAWLMLTWIRADSTADVEVKLGIDLPGGWECGAGEDEVGYSVSGTWRVVLGGDWEELVEVEVRDVTFDRDGDGDFRLDHAIWRVRTPAPFDPDPR